MANYIATIDYARFNSNNALLAASNDGTGDGSGAVTTEIIETPTSSGKFVTGAAPVGNQVVCTTNVESTFEPGQFLFYFDAFGLPTLIGQIDTVVTTTITLTANIIGSGAAMANKELGASYTLISPIETFYIRVGTQVVSGSGGSTIYMPNINTFRAQPTSGEASINNSTVSQVVQYSNFGNPLSIAAAGQQVNFRLYTENIFTQSQQGIYWQNSNQLPQYIWIRCTPVKNAASPSGFSASTMYKFITDEFMQDAVEATINFDGQTLIDAGYKNILL